LLAELIVMLVGGVAREDTEATRGRTPGFSKAPLALGVTRNVASTSV